MKQHHLSEIGKLVQNDQKVEILAGCHSKKAQDVFETDNKV